MKDVDSLHNSQRNAKATIQKYRDKTRKKLVSMACGLRHKSRQSNYIIFVTRLVSHLLYVRHVPIDPDSITLDSQRTQKRH